MSTIYDYSDDIIKMLDKIILKEFNNSKVKVLNGFDELHYFKECDILYKKLDKSVRKYLTVLANKVYSEYDGDTDLIEELSELIDVFLTKPERTTGYAYDSEVLRKKDRLTEVLYTVSRGEVTNEFDKARNLFSKMVAQYCDDITFATYILTLKQNGCKMVKWRTEEDLRVCHLCDPLDNKVFPIDDIPPKQHWGCRCWIEPV